MLITKKKFIYFNFKFFEFVEFIIYFLKNKLNEKLLILKKRDFLPYELYFYYICSLKSRIINSIT